MHLLSYLVIIPLLVSPGRGRGRGVGDWWLVTTLMSEQHFSMTVHNAMIIEATRRKRYLHTIDYPMLFGYQEYVTRATASNLVNSTSNTTLNACSVAVTGIVPIKSIKTKIYIPQCTQSQHKEALQSSIHHSCTPAHPSLRGRGVVLVVDVLLVIRAAGLWSHLLGKILHNLCQDRIATLFIFGISGPYQDQMRIKPDADANTADIIAYVSSSAPSPHRTTSQEPTLLDNLLQNLPNSHHEHLLPKFVTLRLGDTERPRPAILVPRVLPQWLNILLEQVQRLLQRQVRERRVVEHLPEALHGADLRDLLESVVPILGGGIGVVPICLLLGVGRGERGGRGTSRARVPIRAVGGTAVVSSTSSAGAQRAFRRWHRWYRWG